MRKKVSTTSFSAGDALLSAAKRTRNVRASPKLTTTHNATAAICHHTRVACRSVKKSEMTLNGIVWISTLLFTREGGSKKTICFVPLRR